MKEGQQVLCIENARWARVNKLNLIHTIFGRPRTYYGPVINECLVIKTVTIHEGDKYLSFEKYWRNLKTNKIQGFHEESFELTIGTIKK